MQFEKELGIVVRSLAFQERDRICTIFTENQGKVTAITKGGVSSKRFGGTLDFLSCAHFSYVKKESTEMVRVEEAIPHHEFKNIRSDFSALAVASFGCEFILKMLEEKESQREFFVLFSNFLFQIDAGLPLVQCMNAFLVKSYKLMGYSPSLFRNTKTGEAAHEIVKRGGKIFWDIASGGIVDDQNTLSKNARQDGAVSSWSEDRGLDLDVLILFEKFLSTPFKQIKDISSTHSLDFQLYKILVEFLHHHVPGVPQEGFKSLKITESFLIPFV